MTNPRTALVYDHRSVSDTVESILATSLDVVHIHRLKDILHIHRFSFFGLKDLSSYVAYFVQGTSRRSVNLWVLSK
jgi:hypothetical protein